MKKILMMLLLLVVPCFAMDNHEYQPKPGDYVMLKPNQTFVCLMDLSERPEIGAMVIVKTSSNQYKWAKIHKIEKNVPFETNTVERYTLIHYESNNMKCGSYHTTPALYTIKNCCLEK